MHNVVIKIILNGEAVGLPGASQPGGIDSEFDQFGRYISFRSDLVMKTFLWSFQK